MLRPRTKRSDTKMSKPRLAKRLLDLPPYPFEDIDRKKAAARAAGVDVIDLGIGDPDLPTPEHIQDALAESLRRPPNHRYPSYRGSLELRASAARYMERRFGQRLDPAKEVVALIGTKEGIAHLALAILDPGDAVLVPTPAYPVYASSARFLGAEVHEMPLLREHGFLPRLGDIPSEVARRARLIWVNYPNNPLGAVAPRSFYEELAAFAAEYDLVVASDAAYAEIWLEGEPPMSALEIPRLRERVIEFHSLSKTFNMTGWRVGFAAGRDWIVGALGTVKTNVDSGVFGAVQEAAIAALDGPWGPVEELREVYRKRRSVLVGGLRDAGFEAVEMPATFYVVVAVPKGHSAVSYATVLLEKTGVVCTPATAFGPGGEGYVRFSLTAPDERIAQAAERIRGLGKG
jgi:LL-diaminopimelate aminotransferase